MVPAASGFQKDLEWSVVKRTELEDSQVAE